MPYPMMEGKHAFAALVPPPSGPFPEGAPKAAILCYPRWLLREVIETEPTSPYPWRYRGDIHRLVQTGGRIAVVGGIGVGAPSAAMLVEELGAHGVHRFIIVGMAGALDSDLDPCSFAVCDRALRDEGVSHHYLPPGPDCRPSAALTARLTARLTDELRNDGVSVRVGGSWTTDAPYRETLEEAQRYRTEGVITVEMEAAAVFAVAHVRGYEAAAGFVVADHLTDNGWAGHFAADNLRPNLRRLLHAARRAIAAT